MEIKGFIVLNEQLIHKAALKSLESTCGSNFPTPGLGGRHEPGDRQVNRLRGIWGNDITCVEYGEIMTWTEYGK